MFVVYRDFVCKNIFLNVMKWVKIVDFGIVKCFLGGEMVVIGNFGILVMCVFEVFGKWCFSREIKIYGIKVDVFFFGVVLLEVIVGYFFV